jgi:hypothetical protein
MSTMSYCAIENVHLDMGSALGQMEKFIDGDNLNEYERRHMSGLANGCIEYLQLFLTAVQDERASGKYINWQGIAELAEKMAELSEEERNAEHDVEDEDEDEDEE